MSTDNPWVSYAERRPTKEDGSEKGHVFVSDGKYFAFRYWDSLNFATSECWMRISDLPPVPKRKIWREPTQADVDKATEPIPCRVWDEDCEKWDLSLNGISKFGHYRFVTGRGSHWEHCEIEVEE